jgi:hypothetical protein
MLLSRSLWIYRTRCGRKHPIKHRVIIKYRVGRLKAFLRLVSLSKSIMFCLLRRSVRSFESLGILFLFLGARILGPKCWITLLSNALAEINTETKNVEPTTSRSANPLTSDTRVMKLYTERARIVS